MNIINCPAFTSTSWIGFLSLNVPFNRQTLETVNTIKLLGLNIISDLKWNVHVSELVRKISRRLYKTP